MADQDWNGGGSSEMRVQEKFRSNSGVPLRSLKKGFGKMGFAF